MSKIRWTYLWIIVAFASISTILAIINLYKGAHPPTKNFTINSFPLQDTILIGIDNKIEVLMDGEEADGNVSDKFENPINDLNYRAEGNLHPHIVSCTEKTKIKERKKIFILILLAVLKNQLIVECKCLFITLINFIKKKHLSFLK